MISVCCHCCKPLLHLHAHSGVPACRAPWRLAVWYKQTHDQRLLPLLQAQQHFFEGQDLISAGYSLKGKPLETFTNICFLAPVLCLFQVCVLPLMLWPVSTQHGHIT